MARLTFFLSAIIIIILYSASSVEAQDNSTSCNCSNPLTVATFNTLQIFTSENRDERSNATVQYFSQPSQQDIDILCLQELWDPVQRDAVIAAFRGIYNYSYFAPKFPQNCPNGCTVEEIAPLTQCFSDHSCFDDPLDLARCFFDECREEFGNLDPECNSCFEIEDILDIEDSFDRCTDAQLSGNCTFMFGGWSDNLLLSRTPLVNTDFLLFNDSPLAQWTVLYAQTNTSLNTTVNVFCTHLSARVPIVDTSEANAAQITELLSYIREKVPDATAPVFVMGDFNTGPEIGGLDATRPANFIKFGNGGYYSSLLGANITECTYCGSENPLAASSTSEDWMIDHIFIHEQEPVCLVNVTRIAVNNTFVQLGDDETSPISDHYGVKASFCEGTFNLFKHTFTVDTNDDDDGINNNLQGSNGVILSVPVSLILVFVLFSQLWL